MKLFKFKAIWGRDNENVANWIRVNDAIHAHMPPVIRARWMKDGYEGLADSALGYFGINNIYRDEDEAVTFEFTEAQWTWFQLKWL